MSPLSSSDTSQMMVLTERTCAQGKEERMVQETLRGYTTWAACYTPRPRQPGDRQKNTSPFLAERQVTRHALDGRLCM
jgi:hypothetical protein